MSAATPNLARSILQRVGEAGQPPEVGIDHLNVGNLGTLAVLRTEYLEPMAQTGRGSAFKLVQAYYGGGKTHFLYCVRQRAWELGMCSAIVGISPAECPFDHPKQIYAAVARELAWPPEDPDCPPARGIDQTLLTALDERRKQATDEEIVAWIDGTVRRIPVDSASFRSAVVAFLKAEIAGDATTSELVASWLRGEDVNLTEVRHLGIRELVDNETGFRMVRSLCQTLQGIGTPGLLLCFDEIDRVLSLAPRRRRLVADNLRQLIDLCGREQLPGLLCLYAVPPEFMTQLVPEYPALQQRLKGPSALSARSPQAAVIDLENLDLDPEELLFQIGLRILDLFAVAHGGPQATDVQHQNLRDLARETAQTSFDVAHRRAFVKAAVDMLHAQREAPGRVNAAQLRTLAGRAAELTVLAGGGGEEF